MRVFIFSLAGIPILFLFAVLLYCFPSQAAMFYTREEGFLLLGGSSLYLAAHFFIRKPERMYLWSHEFSHLIAAKIFLRKVHSFHITSRDGGKVVIDRTNVIIDLAPYIFPLYSIAAGFTAVIFRPASPSWVGDIYLSVASFLFSMHIVFSFEGFFRGQPDVKRSGRLFSGAVVFLCLLLWIPFLLAPGTSAGWRGAVKVYNGWFSAFAADAGNLLAYACTFY